MSQPGHRKLLAVGSRTRSRLPPPPQVDGIVVRIPFLDCVQNVQLKCGQGRVVFDERTKARTALGACACDVSPQDIRGYNAGASSPRAKL